LKSKLDPKIYGPPESAITTEMIQREIGGLMSVKEVKQYHIYIKLINGDYYGVCKILDRSPSEMKGLIFILWYSTLTFNLF
jgi:hypothetical protein